MTYLIVFGIYRNCHITREEEREIFADTPEEARKLAEQEAEGIEFSELIRECEALKANGAENASELASDWWARIEDLYPIQGEEA